MELVKMGLVDPMKVFVKQEPHKTTKIEEGRVRLICSVSLIDNIIARLLCSIQNNTEIKYNARLPVKPGLGLHDDGLACINDYVREKFSDCTPVEGDAKGWDWSVQEWDFTMDCERRVALCNAEGTVFERLLRAHFYVMARKVFVLSDGSMHEQLKPGIMPSGWYNTSSSNSNMRCMNHFIIADHLDFEPEIMAMGDDSIEKSFEDPINWYSKLGKNMSMFNEVSVDSFEFCSTQFDGSLGTPVNVDKILFNLLSNKTNNLDEACELWSAFLFNIRNLPQIEKDSLLEVVERSKWLSFHKLQFQNGCIVFGSRDVIDQNGFRANQNAERLRGSPLLSRHEMYSPGPLYRYPIPMAKTKTKNNSKVKALENQIAVMKLSQQKQKKKKSTPFGDVGNIVGQAAGNLFGRGKMGSSIGRWLGSGIGSIFGSGDYQMVGTSPKYNILSGSVPQFSSSHATNIVCHREYIGDIAGTTGFNNNIYPLNPGVQTAFPWLQTVATNYQQYRFHGIMFEFRPLITDFVTSGAPGVVVMSTSYNADLPKYLSKQEMENAEFAVSTKPTMTLRHMVECDPQQTSINQLYVRSGSVPVGQDLRLYDLGNFQFATQSNPNQNLGELWVTYCVEFFKPTLDLANSATGATAAHIVRTNVSAANPLGTIGILNTGTLSVTTSGTVMTITNATVGVIYNINIVFTCTVAATNNIALPNITSGATGLAWNASLGVADSANFLSTNGTASTVAATNQFLTATSSTVVLTYVTSGTYGTGSPSVEILISAVDPALTG